MKPNNLGRCVEKSQNGPVVREKGISQILRQLSTHQSLWCSQGACGGCGIRHHPQLFENLHLFGNHELILIILFVIVPH